MTKKRVTSQDVAERAGVSRTTVSFVLNNVEGVQLSAETRQRVLDAAHELGYIPDAAARSLVSGRAASIGLVMSRSAKQIASDAYLSHMLDSLVREANRKGLRLMLDILEDDTIVSRCQDIIGSKRLDGVIYSGPRFHDEALELFSTHNFPTVLMGQFPGGSFSWVDIDNRGAAYSATRHLIQLGHRQIACITNASMEYTAAAQRMAGYQDALREGGLTFDPDLLRCGDFDFRSGYQQMSNLLHNSGKRPTAVFVASDVLAVGALSALRELNLRVPQDIAIVGFDDIPLASYLDPPLTTVRLPVNALVDAAVEMLVQLIEGQTPEPAHLLLDTELVIRRSCGANATQS